MLFFGGQSEERSHIQVVTTRVFSFLFSKFIRYMVQKQNKNDINKITPRNIRTEKYQFRESCPYN